MTEKALVVIEPQAMSLPDKITVERELAAVRAFQMLVRQTLIDGHDYGVIPGTRKPTLLKPGAEKIAKLLNLADTYEILSKTEDWKGGFFAYEVRATLSHRGEIVSTGLGECNSMEAKYRWRWVWPDDVPEGIDHTKLVYRITDNGGKQYRFENDDIFSQVNTLLKMAKKRALVDAALSASRLSDIFTQDIEDLKENGVISGEPGGDKTKEKPSQNYYCQKHKTQWFKSGKMKSYAHPVEGSKEWCQMPTVEDIATTSPAVKVENTITEPPVHVVSTHVGPAEPPKQAPEGKTGQVQGKLSQEDVDRVSRALAAAGWLPEKRPELYEGKWFKTNFPGFTTIPDMGKADAERLIRALELAVNPKQAKAPAQSRIMDAESGEAF